MLVAGPEVAAWVFEEVEGCVSPTTNGLGWMNSEGNIVGGFAMEGFNGVNAYVHQRHDKPATKTLWWAMADWCFNQVGCDRITATVNASNNAAISLNYKIGFKHECTMKRAAEDGSDMLIMVLWKEDCRMLKWGRNGESI
jgi:L-amino acid N-acyltransferase YncA